MYCMQIFQTLPSLVECALWQNHSLHLQLLSEVSEESTLPSVFANIDIRRSECNHTQLLAAVTASTYDLLQPQHSETSRDYRRQSFLF